MAVEATSTRVYLFGDETFNYEHSLTQLLRSDNHHLNRFFRDAYAVIRKELGSLPLHSRDTTPKISNLNELITRKRDGSISPALEQVLCLIHLFASFIGKHTQGELSYPTARDSQLVGVGIGALAAASIASSESLATLIPAAIHAIVIALHTGLRADLAVKSIQGSTSSESWAMTVAGVSDEQISSLLDRFNQKHNLPPSSIAYISAISGTDLTISGPPAVLAKLRNDADFTGFEIADASIRSPRGAKHLFGDEDVDAIMANSSYMAPSESNATIPVLSSGTGHAVWARSPQSIMISAVHDILTRPARFEKVVEHLESSLKSSAPSQVSILPFGSNASDFVQARLTAALGGSIPVNIEPSWSANPDTPLYGPKGKCKIAVVGMAGRFPGASNPNKLWSLLQQRVDMCAEVPPLRWNADTHVDPTGKAKNTSKVRWGCWLDEPEMFDAPFFGISPREAPQVDPAQRLALLTAYEAIEHAGIVPGRTPSTREDRLGVFYGVTSNDWCEANSGQDIDVYYIPGANRAFIPGRINYFFKFSGPSYAIDTACSSSLSAVHIACNSLWQGDIDMAIAGGTNVLTNPDMTTGLDKGHFLSTTGNCKTFDASADGYCRGEGVATVLLKRLEDAIDDGDTIHAILGSAYTNHSAEAESITRPHVGAQRDVLERVLNDAGAHPHEVSYIEMHGTGTQAGDLREMTSVCEVFAPAEESRRRSSPLHVGALKANIGHGESVSGVSALIKLIMMMKHDQIPPHCGIKTTLNPHFPKDLDARNVRIDLEAAAWPKNKDGLPRKAIINNFSAAGGNSSILVEDAPAQLQDADVAHDSQRPIYPVAVSARSGKALAGNLKALLDYLNGSSTVAASLPEISYTTTARRIHHHFRFVTSASDITILKSNLAAAVEKHEPKRAIPPKSVLFTFTGQGSQYPGMGKQLLETLTVFRDHITQFDRLARTLGFPAILPLFLASSGDNVADYSPVVVQLANTCMQVALARIWVSWGVKPTAVVGHSLGEYAALNVAGVLSDADTVYLVGRRAQLLQQFCQPDSHAMLAVNASVSDLQKIGSDFEVACINAPKETVLAGTKAQISGWKGTLSSNGGIRSTLLNVPYAFHSSQVQPILSAFANDAKGVTFQKPQLPVVCPLEGSVITEDGVFGPEYVGRHAREPVQMMKCLEAASSGGILPEKGSIAVEFGPHPVVSGMIKATLGSDITILSTLRRKSNPWEVLTTSLCSLYEFGCTVDWNGYFSDLPSAQKKVVELPSYSWDLKSYWIPYRNDWTLTKGDIPIDDSKSSPEGSETPAAAKTPVEPASPPPLESTTIHKVLEENATSSGFSISIESDVDREDINPFIRSHTVDGYSLCTPAVYADIGFSLGSYALKRFQPDFPERTVSMGNIDITRALIGNIDWKQRLRCSAKFDWATKGAKLRFTVHEEAGAEVGQLSTCELKFVDDSTQRQVQNDLPTFKANFERMQSSDKVSRFTGSISYRLVSALASFNPDYHCVDSVLYDNDAYEAAFRVSFGQMKKIEGSSFFVNPGAVDGLTQSAGFVMNANDNTKLDTEVFVNHGWNDFQLFEPIRDDCQYSTHVKMTQGEENLWSGDILIFEGDRAVGFVRGVKIQGLPRRFLKHVLSQAAKPPKSVKAKTTGAAAGSKPASAPAASTTPAPAAKKAPSAPASEKAAPQAAAATNSAPTGEAPMVKKALELISEESEIPTTDLHDDTRMTDVGIDSLVSLLIASRFTEELGITTDSALFLEDTTVANVKQFVIDSTSGDDSSASAPEPAPQEACPAAEAGTVPSHAESPAPQPDTFAEASDMPSINFDDVVNIMAEEIEIAPDTITDSTSLTDLGVDSLLSLMIGSRLRDELEIELDTSSLLTELSTVGALRQALTSESGGSSSSSSSEPGSDASSSPSEVSRLPTPPSEPESEPVSAPVPPTSSVVLQGNPRTATSALWFFPDGSGLASSYLPLSRIRNDLVVYGINSPFLKKGTEMKCSWDELIGSYIREVQRRQPEGPYSFAGWSAGGIGAFHAAQVLMNNGYNVRDLIILDSPPPFHLAPLPERFFKYCVMAGLFGGRDGQTPEWVINHFRNINNVLSNYIPKPLGKSTLRKINILWACESSVDERFERRPDDPEDMKFLTTRRTDFTPGRWGPLFGDTPVVVDSAEGEHHWSILKGDSAAKVSQYIARALV